MKQHRTLKLYRTHAAALEAFKADRDSATGLVTSKTRDLTLAWPSHVQEYRSAHLIQRLRGQAYDSIQHGDDVVLSPEQDLILDDLLGIPRQDQDVLLPIRQAARMLCICPHTLRLYEKDGKISCVRTLGGHRRYSLREVQRLQREGFDTRVRPSVRVGFDPVKEKE